MEKTQNIDSNDIIFYDFLENGMSQKSRRYQYAKMRISKSDQNRAFRQR